ncbi:MAG: DUF4082 domain-containing protein [Acidobacteriota bacterium]
MVRKLVLAGLMALATSAAWGTSVTAVTVTPDSGNTFNNGGLYTLGFEFSISGPVTVDSLGYFSPSILLESHDVGIYTTGGTLLASATVTAADTLVGNFTFQSISPLNLAAGNYIIAGTSGATDLYAFNPTTVSFMAGMTFVESRYNSGASLAFPANPDIGVGYFGPNFTVSSAPEPSSILLLTSSLLLGLGVKRMKKS